MAILKQALSACAYSCLLIACAACAQQPAVNLSLNLRYNDPADSTEGGRWFLVAKTDDPDGIAAIDAYIASINPDGIVYGNSDNNANDPRYPAIGQATLNANLPTTSGNPFNGIEGNVVNVFYGQETSLSAPNDPMLGVGTPSFAARTVNDPLENVAWDDATLIASGIFGAVRPAFALSGPGSTTVQTLAGSSLGQMPQDADVNLSVRGDSLIGLGLNDPPAAGLLRGDGDRDFDVDSDDLHYVLLRFNLNAPMLHWSNGDVTDGLSGHVEGKVDADDLNWVLLNFNRTSPAPSVYAVPELSSLLLAAGAVFALPVARRVNRISFNRMTR